MALLNIKDRFILTCKLFIFFTLAISSCQNTDDMNAKHLLKDTESYCGISIFTLKPRICHEGTSIPNVLIRQTNDSIMFNINDLQQKLEENEIVFIKSNKKIFTHQFSFIEDDGSKVNEKHFLVIDSLLFKFITIANCDYIQSMAYVYTKTARRVYHFKNKFMFDENKICDTSYLLKNSQYTEVGHFILDSNSIVINNQVSKYHEIEGHNSKIILKPQNFGLEKENINSIQEAIFWYYEVLKIW